MLRSPVDGSHAQSAILARPEPKGGGAAIERGDAGCRTWKRRHRLSKQSGAANDVGVKAAALQQGYGDGRKVALGRCHRPSGMRRIGAPRGQHDRDHTETWRALQH
ncbi:hypothetical protein [Paraburkholderia sp. RAU2J]|uniref:hypothetical protein n=1 Tax=Paraburkholderia sp. RAU2J TaxID=1938810 RepID=UPI001315A583|nr:hypothetical protein [Paraburkholderia sp. RAU2J]